jgi:hypothetical protein
MGPSRRSKGSPREFYAPIIKALEDNPEQLSVIKAHLQNIVERADNRSDFDLRSRDGLSRACIRHGEIMASLIRSDDTWEALQSLSEAVRRNSTGGEAQNTGEVTAALIFVPIVIGVLIGIDACIWDAVVGAVDALCFD